MKDKAKAKDIIRNVGSRSVAALVAVFLLTIAVTGIGCYQLYRSTKESIHLQGRVNAVQSAKEFDDYLIVRKNTVVLAAHVVDGMINEGRAVVKVLRSSDKWFGVTYKEDKEYVRERIAGLKDAGVYPKKLW